MEGFSKTNYATHQMHRVHKHPEHNAWQEFDGVDRCENCDRTMYQCFLIECPAAAFCSLCMIASAALGCSYCPACLRELKSEEEAYAN